MKKILFSLVALVCSMSINAQVMKIMKGNTVVATYTAEEADNVVFEEEHTLPAGALSGEFSVDSIGTKVHFSQGNLQAKYDGGAEYTWGFAENQYDVIGDAAGNTTIDSQSIDNVVDLFGWPTIATNYGICTSTELSTYYGDFVDWGKNIGDGNTWRTLSAVEWNYLIKKRTVNGGAGKDKSYSLNVTYGGIMGLVLYPDDYAGSVLSGTVETLPEGVVFLPAAGGRTRTVSGVNVHGYYSSSTAKDDRIMYIFGFISDLALACVGDYRPFGYSVRLVTESK